jgi:glycosyltransferase involved in cell wall biosynthesis
VDILKRYRKNMTYFISEKDSGVYNAMNKAILKSSGEYLIFLNGGDMLLGNNIMKDVSVFIKKDKSWADIYYGDLKYDNGEIVTYKSAVLNRSFFINKSISHQAAFIRRRLFSNVGLYNEKYKIVADFDFWISAILENKARVKYLPHVVSIFDQNGVSTNPEFYKRQINERNDVLLNHHIIGKGRARVQKLRWSILTIFKRVGIYKVLRKIYRILVKR